ncbi:hypothetical protein [Streptomyces sp. NPDC059008]|uniref:hypothetical protein n=1 Tax=Streptomyces sp. NPDC059008 TaxID=3346693 RepID=UPI0036C634ED
MAIAAESFAGRFLAAVSRRGPAFRPPQPARPRGKTPPRAFIRRLNAIAASGARLRMCAKRLRAELVELPAEKRIKTRDALHELAYGITRFQVVIQRLILHADVVVEFDAMANSPGFVQTNRVLGEDVRAHWDELREQVCGRFTELGASGVEAGLLALFSEVGDEVRMGLAMFRRERYVRLVGFSEAQSRLSAIHEVMDSVQRFIESAADDFSGADLTRVDPGTAYLAWLQWDEATRWRPDWEDRIRRMSVERAPGQYVIQPMDVEDRSGLLADA